MSFLSPERLLLLAAVLLLAGIYAAVQFRRKQYAVRFTNLDLLATVAPRAPGWRRHATALAFMLALATFIVAFAQPARAERIPKERATVILTLDTSLSMDATDVSPSRFEAEKDAAQSFVDDLPETINLGLVSFDGSAIMRVAPTLDHQSVRDAIDTLELGQDTAIGDAIVASLAAIETVPEDQEGTAPPGAIVLLSDGTTTKGIGDLDAAGQAADAGVPVSTIAFGTPTGTVQLPGDLFPTPVPVDEDSLRAIAEATDGTFFTAASGDELKAVYQDIGSSVGYEEEQREITAWFVGLGIVLLAATAAGSLVWFSRLP
jgi:Ca-activated chloride channel family protein